MRAWIPSLLASSNPVLSSFGTKVEQKVAAADAHVASQAVAEQKNRDFRAIGARKALLDSLNALRKATCGKLSELLAHDEIAAKARTEAAADAAALAQAEKEAADAAAKVAALKAKKKR